MRLQRSLAHLALVLPGLVMAPHASWAQEAPSPRDSPAPEEAPAASSAEPEFEPGIPGLKMADVRDHKFLWREIEELQVWERADRISIAEFRGKTIEKTAHFLGLTGSAADQFASAASEEVSQLRRSFLDQRRRPVATAGAMDDPVSSRLAEATARMTALLKDEPRHELFAPDFKKWLLKLAFGPKEAKEAKEARAAQGQGTRPARAATEPD